jgi:4-aminobutyrate aminotransferase-like enzyme
VPSAAALAVLDTIEREGLLARARAIGERLAGAVAASAPPGALSEIRGRGCLWGFDLGPGGDAHAVTLAMLAAGVLATTAGPTVVRMSPPLTATDDEIDLAAGALVESLASTGVAV